MSVTVRMENSTTKYTLPSRALKVSPSPHTSRLLVATLRPFLYSGRSQIEDAHPTSFGGTVEVALHGRLLPAHPPKPLSAKSGRTARIARSPVTAVTKGFSGPDVEHLGERRGVLRRDAACCPIASLSGARSSFRPLNRRSENGQTLESCRSSRSATACGRHPSAAWSWW